MQRCPRTDCNRAGDDLGTCADKSVVGCPHYVEVTSGDVLIHCTPCNITRAFPIGNILKGKMRENCCQGETDHCKAHVVRPPKPTGK